MVDWYRRKTWSDQDEVEFFAKLSRAHKAGRAQYLRIQGVELVRTKNPTVLNIAERLTKLALTDYPDSLGERSACQWLLGEICQLQSEFEQALYYYRAAIQTEIDFPGMTTDAYLDYAELVMNLKKGDEYAFAEKILLDRKPVGGFPIQKYRAFQVLAFLTEARGDQNAAEQYKQLAQEQANATHSGFYKHPTLGLVKK